MSDSWKPWAGGAAVIAVIVGWFWWQRQFPTPMDGTYSCTGQTVAIDGERSSIDASAQVVDGKIRTGPTGADIAVGHDVTSWGDVEQTSQHEFLVEITPTGEMRQVVTDPFWITCTRDTNQSPLNQLQ